MFNLVNNKGPIILAVGDVLFLSTALIGALIVRNGSLPSINLLYLYMPLFSIILMISLITFYIAGLYGREVHLSHTATPSIIIKSQIANILFATFLFYFVPSPNVTPKSTLLIYTALSSLLLILWRVGSYRLSSLRKRYPALVIGEGKEMDDLIKECSTNPRSSLWCVQKINFREISRESLLKQVSTHVNIKYIVADMNHGAIHSALPLIYEEVFPTVRVINPYDLYESLFERIQLSLINYQWIMANISSVSPKIYDIMKRLIDIFFGIIIGIVCCFLYPFVSLAIFLEDRGSVFITQKRVGKGGKIIKIYKYRTMERSDNGKWLQDNDNKVTKVGLFLRKTRIDELPQALALLKGDMSVIGPRADIVDLAERLEREIPYYSVRNIIAPGISGWAQINQEKPPQSVEATKIRLSYDLYYIKHRSITLDLRIALRTIKTLLSRTGM